jgi:hypothetical protein
MKRIFVRSLLAVSVALSTISCGQQPESPLAVGDKREERRNKSLEQSSAGKENKPWEQYGVDGQLMKGEGRRRRGRVFAQEIHTPQPLKTMVVSHLMTLPVTVRNTSREIWKAAGSPEEKQPVNLAYHWIEGPTVRQRKAEQETPTTDKSPGKLRVWRTAALQQQGRVVVFGGRRTVLPHDIEPGEVLTLNAQIQAPDRPGDFTLRVTMVKENVSWFEDRGAQPLDLPVTVTAR